MNQPSRPGSTERFAQRTYRGIWAILRTWFRVPEEPPTLPVAAGATLHSFRPSEGYLRYLTLQFWILLLILDGAILVAWIVLTVAMPLVGAALALPALVLAIVPDVFIYIGIHLRYDTMWYVMSDRSIRMRRGIWVIQEVTITFENVQNVSVNQGPLQRWFGIANVTVHTAGGGGAVGPNGTPMEGHVGIIEGIADAPALRDAIMAKVRASRTAGLGDEATRPAPPAGAWSAEHLALLREIREAARAVTAA